MFTSINDFLSCWEQESQAVLKLFDQLTDQSLAQKVTKDHRTLGRVAWHVVTSITEMMPKTGLTLKGPDPDAPVPKSAAKISSGFQATSASLVEQIRSKWTDASLQEINDIYGFKWKRGYTLYILIIHQAHHLGQMTVLMRQAGLKVPGIYGPSKEEWAQFGMQAPEV